MKATFPGEYIHMILVGVSTLKDGDVIMFISVDNFSRYCFSHVVKSPMDFEKLTNHLNTIIDDLPRHQPDLLPTFIMGYGEYMRFKLTLHYKGRAQFQFNEDQADEIAGPVAKDVMKNLTELLDKNRQ